MHPLKLILLITIFITAACAQNKPTATPAPEKPITHVSPSPTPAPEEPGQPRAPTAVTVKYVANMGVLISGGGKNVLIDAIHQKYKPTYLFPTPDVLKSMETAAAPYDKIDLVLITHNHLDHFHAGSTMLHLQNNPKVVVVAPEQIVKEMSALAGFEAVKTRVIGAPYSKLSKTTEEKNGVKVTLIDLKHVNPQFSGIQNVGYIVEIGDKKILHVGDAELTEANFAEYKLPDMKLDAAILPAWFLNDTGSCSQVKKLIGARVNIATHIPPDHAGDYINSLETNCPGTVAFTKVGEEKAF